MIPPLRRGTTLYRYSRESEATSRLVAPVELLALRAWPLPWLCPAGAQAAQHCPWSVDMLRGMTEEGARMAALSSAHVSCLGSALIFTLACLDLDLLQGLP